MRRPDLFLRLHDLPVQVPTALQEAVSEALRGFRTEVLDMLARDAQLMAASSEAVVLGAPSKKKRVSYRTSYHDDLAFTVTAGPAEMSLTFHREPHNYHGRLLHRGSCWSATETRQDVFGNEWERYVPGYMVMDDFGDLVPVEDA